MDNVAIIWDVENVNPGNNTFFLDGLIEYAESFGRVVTARAYANWSNRIFARLAPSLVKRYFFLIHIPKGKKNSTDIGLITDTFELLKLYEHIDRYILVTGDSDFRFLIISLRRAGKKINIVCNTQNASEDLLELADNAKDYRELLPVEEDENQNKNNDEISENVNILSGMTDQDWFLCLVEVIYTLRRENKKCGIGLVKIRMKKFNPNFNENQYNFKRWSDFVSAAVSRGYIKIKNEQIFPAKPYRSIFLGNNSQLIAFQNLKKILTELDNEEDKFYELAKVNRKLMQSKINVKILGFKQFKDFVKAAEARNMVEYQVDGIKHMIKLKKRNKILLRTETHNVNKNT